VLEPKLLLVMLIVSCNNGSPYSLMQKVETPWQQSTTKAMEQKRVEGASGGKAK
jgi:hypothetical protein